MILRCTSIRETLNVNQVPVGPFSIFERPRLINATLITWYYYSNVQGCMYSKDELYRYALKIYDLTKNYAASVSILNMEEIRTPEVMLNCSAELYCTAIEKRYPFLRSYERAITIGWGRIARGIKVAASRPIGVFKWYRDMPYWVIREVVYSTQFTCDGRLWTSDCVTYLLDI